MTDETLDIGNHVLHRVRYLVDIPRYGVKRGDLGGWLESDKNLEHVNDCVILDNAWVREWGFAEASANMTTTRQSD